MTRLPNQIRSIISVSGEPLEKIAIMADKYLVVSDNASILEIAATKSTTANDIFQQPIHQLTKEIYSLRTHFLRSRSRNRSTSSGRHQKTLRNNT